MANVTYTVKKGDALSKIAASYGMNYKTLAEYNGITNPDLIKVGQKILIPVADTVVAAPKAESTGSTKKGLDLSGWQNDFTNGSLLKTGGIDFVILKVTEGTGFTNSSFSHHYDMCKAQAVPVGAYVFSHAIGANGGKAEAEYAIKVLAGRKLELPVYLDIEASDILNSGKAQIMAAIRAFGSVIKAAGYKVGVYASRSTFQSYMDLNALRNEGYSIWCAAYNNTGAGVDCDIWQHTDKGRIAGYSGNLDFNIMYNTSLLSSGGSTVASKPATNSGISVALPQLQMGSQGAAVRSLQHLLIRKFSISCGTNGADGDFGKNTQSAVKTFQKRKGLPVTGICDKDTWTALLVG